MKELGASAWGWPELLEGRWGNTAPDVFEPEHGISWLVDTDDRGVSKDHTY